MLALFRRAGAAAGECAMGATHVARALPAGARLPAACLGVAVDAGGRTWRIEQGAAPVAAARSWCVHPGPYTIDVIPFAAAPEIGLRITLAIDSADPRLAQQRFDLYLAAEVQDELPLAVLEQQLQAALARALEQGALALPPCTSTEEWHRFRAGLDQLVYTRCGLTVDECLPVDLGEARDYAAMLLARAQLAPEPGRAAPAHPQPPDPHASDAAALRRLLLELPAVAGRLRQAGLPPPARKSLLARLDLLALAVCTMPALGLSAPGQALAMPCRLRRAAHSRRAAAALDEAWALLARIEQAPSASLPALADEAGRVVAGLEQACAARRAIAGEAA